jgi:hypothetical protein
MLLVMKIEIDINDSLFMDHTETKYSVNWLFFTDFAVYWIQASVKYINRKSCAWVICCNHKIYKNMSTSQRRSLHYKEVNCIQK